MGNTLEKSMRALNYGKNSADLNCSNFPLGAIEVIEVHIWGRMTHFVKYFGIHILFLLMCARCKLIENRIVGSIARVQLSCGQSIASLKDVWKKLQRAERNSNHMIWREMTLGYWILFYFPSFVAPKNAMDILLDNQVRTWGLLRSR